MIRLPLRSSVVSIATALVSCVSWGLLGLTAPASAEPQDELQAARMALERYEPANGAQPALDTFARLTALLKARRLRPREHGEARFLRAAAASDLLILARVRGDAALSERIGAALGVSSGNVDAFLDGELAASSAGPFREAEPMRSALALSRRPSPWPWSELRALAGSQGALLFLHQFAALAVTEHDATRVLADYGVDPCGGDVTCPEPYAAFDAAGRAAMLALHDAGRAVDRLQEAASAGDPLAAAAVIELATFMAALPAVELRPALRPKGKGVWLDASGHMLPSAPEFLLRVSGTGVRYGFAPRARLRPDGEIELYSAYSPMLPETAELPFRATLPPFMESVPELVMLLSSSGARSANGVALVIEPGTPAHRLGRVLASARRAGHDRLLVMGQAADGSAVAETVRIEGQDEISADVTERAQVAVRVRLGGYTLYERERREREEIPRVRDERGFRYDDAALAARLGSLRMPSSQLSFMGEVAADQVMVALLEAARTSRSLGVVLP